jgi:hypothetical protein
MMKSRLRLSFALARSTVLALALLAATAPRAHAGPLLPGGVCNPKAAVNNQAKTAIRNANLPLATQLLSQVLAARKDDFMAQYLTALVDVRLAGRSHVKYLAAVKNLETLATTLGKQDQGCAVQNDFYSIYNTIGAEYYNDDNLPDAKRFFAIARQHFDKLSSASKGNFFGDQGLVASKEKNYACALFYYDQAIALGNHTIDEQRESAAQITSATGQKPGCRTAKS